MTREEFSRTWGHIDLAVETYEMLLDCGAVPEDFAKAMAILDTTSRRVGNEWGFFRATIWNLVATRRQILATVA